MSEVKRVAIDKVCWKSKIKDWNHMSEINVWDHAKNDFNIKYTADNKQKNSNGKSLQSRVIFKYLS